MAYSMKQKILTALFNTFKVVETIALVLVLIALSWYLYNHYKTDVLDVNKLEFENGIQNHLVWDVKGRCYFTKPMNEDDVRLIYVEDCNKTLPVVIDPSVKK